MVPNMVPNLVLIVWKTIPIPGHPWTACFRAITPGSVRVVNMAASSPGLESWESWARRFILDREKRWKMNQNEPKWTKMNQNEPKWTKMNQNEPKWTKMNQNEPKRTKMNQNEPTFLRKIAGFWRSDAKIFVPGPNLMLQGAQSGSGPSPWEATPWGFHWSQRDLNDPKAGSGSNWDQRSGIFWNYYHGRDIHGDLISIYIYILSCSCNTEINDICILIDVSLSVHFMSWKTRDILFRHDIKIATFALGTQRKPITTDFWRYPVDDVIFFNILIAFRVYQQLHLVSKHTRICNSKETH